jgi:predicted AAA+ superfamily ATPase
MAITNNERVGRALDHLKSGLRPFVEREMKAVYKDRWVQAALPSLPNWQSAKPDQINLDVQALLKLMWELWNDVFKNTLGPSERSLVSELRGVRDRHAHQKTFSGDDTYRALDSCERLLTATNSTEPSEAVKQIKDELLRLRFEEQLRSEKRREAAVPTEGKATGGLPAWRDLVVPHPDVASGRYSKAEFAADLWHVFLNEGSDEYKDPIEFYRRTYITEGLKNLLANAVRRLNGQGGDPVVELQTNFGGGKTHSMLALYHLASGTQPSMLPGLDVLAKETGTSLPPKIRRAVIVGNKISPADIHTKKDGTRVRTLWGELAWQLGGAEGYALVKDADEHGVSPGDNLRLLLQKYQPAVILIDEWVAYARQLYNKSDLPAGDFDAHFTFAQTLSESVKLAEQTLLVVSIPSSQNEIGGEGGQAALERLKNVLVRVETTWRPASAEESFEIVRRRLFQPMSKDNFVQRDLVLAKFAEEYRKNPQEYPADASKPEYEKRLRAAYPIHPELFDRLYNDWSTLDKFQRTRGVLRLMASVIHTLWERQDRGLLILPASVPMDDDDVAGELTKYLDDVWRPVIEQDVDGPNSMPLRMDRENSLFGQYSAARRVARTLYLGSAPTQEAANKGLDDRQIKLGCVQPGESSARFGDALRKLADQATHLFVDGNRYWLSTRPSVNRIAEERSERLDQEDVWEEIRRRLRDEPKSKGEFVRVQPCPSTASEIPDEPEARLVILGPEVPHDPKSGVSLARKAAQTFLDRGGQGRSCGNMLVFLAADKSRVAELEQAARQYLAWKSIVKEKAALNLDPFQLSQAEKREEASNSAVRERIPEAYFWALVPQQELPKAGQPYPPVNLQETKAKGSGSLAERTSKTLIGSSDLLTVMGATVLRLKLDEIPLWRNGHVTVKQLIEDFAKYPYLPRLRDSQVLIRTIQDGVANLQWQLDAFAYAESYDATSSRYRGLKAGEMSRVPVVQDGLVVRPEVAVKQFEEERKPELAVISGSPVPSTTVGGFKTPDGSTPAATVPAPRQLRRFYGSVALDPLRMSRDADTIAREVVQRFDSLTGAKVTVKIDITVDVPNGVPEGTVRTISENCRTLKFESSGFEE